MPPPKKVPPENIFDPSGERFDEFWLHCPPKRRVGKKEAQKAFAKALLRAPAEKIIAAWKVFAEEVKAAGTEKHFIPHPSTWLNQERWNDEDGGPDDGGGKVAAAVSAKETLEDMFR